MMKPRNDISGIASSKHIGEENLKRLVNKALARLVKSIRSKVEKWEEKARKEANSRHNFAQDDYAYPWLNYLFTKLLSEGGGQLRPNYTWGGTTGCISSESTRHRSHLYH
jgi:hypothetical protein